VSRLRCNHPSVDIDRAARRKILFVASMSSFGVASSALRENWKKSIGIRPVPSGLLLVTGKKPSRCVARRRSLSTLCVVFGLDRRAAIRNFLAGLDGKTINCRHFPRW
jgi:hypothetical protein